MFRQILDRAREVITIENIKKHKKMISYFLLLIISIFMLIGKFGDNARYMAGRYANEEYIVDNVLVNDKKIGHAKVISNMMLEKGPCVSGNIIEPSAVAIHQTGCIDTDADVMHESLRNLNSNPDTIANPQNYKIVSWTITVGYDKIIQNMPLNWEAYSQGTEDGNKNAISIEICMYTDRIRQEQAYENAIELYKILNANHHLKLTKHQDYSGKYCPQWLLEGKDGYTWEWFQTKCFEK